MKLNDFSISDAEFLYMIHQSDQDAMARLYEHYIRLIWKRSHDSVTNNSPIGINVEDISQEAYIGYKEGLFGFNEVKQCGLAFYLSMCVESNVKTLQRKCRSGNYRALNPKFSLDIPIGEQDSLTRIDLIESKQFHHDPRKMAAYHEVNEMCINYLGSLKEHEQKVHALRDEGHSYSSIAQELDISVKDVDNIVQKIRRNTKKLFYS